MKSFALLRTNVALTSNIKLMVDSKYSLYMESIDSAEDLSISSLKKVQFSKDNFWDELVPNFYKGFPADIAFSINYDNDVDNMSNDYSEQYDEMYIAGAKNIINNKNYTEEYEYFAPLYVFKDKLPKYFSIFRIDGPGLIDMNKDNFREEFLNNFKAVKVFDLTRNSPLGEFIDRNWKINENFPNTGLDLDFRELEFTRWIGIDYDSGGYTHKSLYFDEELERESTLFGLEQLITDGYRVNKVIHPNLINFTFLFDDTPSTPSTLRKWSLNRYSGFYLDEMEEYDKIHPFKLPELHSDIFIGEGNRIYSSSKGDPFLRGFKGDDTMWVEHLGEFYRVEKYDRQLSKRVSAIKKGDRKKQVTIDEVNDPTEVSYRIISDINLVGLQTQLNQRHCYIDNQGRIIDASTDLAYIIDDYSFSDVTMININDVFHTIVYENGYYKLNTDYGFNYSEGYRLTYYTNSGIEGFTEYINLNITTKNTPINFPIHRLKFTDVKDFDTNIVDTEFSKFEYERRSELTRTEEPKLYLTDLRSNSTPTPFDDFIFKGKTELVPVSSDYTANLETFRIDNNDLSELWRKSPVHLRWAYQNSLSAHDYPYLMNNTDLHGTFNQTVNTRELVPMRSERNLDYFYTINSGTTSHIHHTFHVEKNNGNVQDETYKFKIDDYLNVSTYSYYGNTFSYDMNYFDLFFSQTQSFLDGDISRNKKKYSHFDVGDDSIPNTTVFRGIKFKLFEVDSIIKDSVSIKNLNLFTKNTFDDYKFSVLLSSNDKGVSDDGTLYDTCEIGTFEYSTSLGLGVTEFFTSGATPSFIVGDEIELDYPPNQLSSGEVSGIVSSPGGHTFSVDTGIDESHQVGGKWRGKMQWTRIYNFETDTPYKRYDVVMYEGETYWAGDDITITDPTETPAGWPTQFNPFQTEANTHMFWTGNQNPTNSPGSCIYIYGEYYERSYTINGQYNQYNPTQYTDFWDAGQFTYTIGSVVNYKNRFYEAIEDVPTGIRPIVSNRKMSVNFDGTKYWNEIPSSQVINFVWNRIPLWDVNENIPTNINDTNRVYDGVLYKKDNNVSVSGEDIPGLSIIWERLYSFIPDTNYKYSAYTNPVIQIDNVFYLNKFNPGQATSYIGSTAGDYTLDNGITIYIHKPFKNVFVNIAFNDNTLQAANDVIDETRNIERDELYVQPNSRITACNFIRQINDLDTIYGFADYTSYVVVENDFTISKYNFGNNLENLPYYLLAEEADLFKIDDSSLTYEVDGLSKNILKPFRSLENGNIDNLEKINFYNENPIAYNIENNEDVVPVTTNLNGQNTNDTTQSLFRHSGYYMPLVYEVELFRDSSVYDSDRGVTYNNLRDNWHFSSLLPASGGVFRLYGETNPGYSIGDYITVSGAAEQFDFIDNNFYAGSFALLTSTHSINVGDVITVFQYEGYTHTQYNGDHTITNVTNTLVVTNQSNLGSTPVQGGIYYRNYYADGLHRVIDVGVSGNGYYVDIDEPYVNNSPPHIGTTNQLIPVSPLSMRSGNYTFDTNLSLFGVKRQRVIQKVNEIENVLKLKNNDSFNSIYPMLDEFGYMVADFFIFKSTWDFLYHYKTNNPKITSATSQQNIFRTQYIQQIIKNYNTI